MADKKKRKTKTRRPTRKQAATTPATPAPLLDLTRQAEHPTVRLPEGDFKMRAPEELTFAEFGRSIQILNTLVERAECVGDDGVLDEMQALVVEAAHLILIDLTDEAAGNLSPGAYFKIANFFNELATQEREAEASEPGSSSVPGASDSTEVSEAA